MQLLPVRSRILAPLAGLALLSLAVPGWAAQGPTAKNLYAKNLSARNLSSGGLTPANGSFLRTSAGNNSAGNDATAGSMLRSRSRAVAVAPLSLDVSKFAFTAPGRAAASKAQTVERSFTFTPSRSAANGVSLGVTTRAVVPTATASLSDDQQPAGYNVDLSVGYRGFAITGGMTHADGGLGGREQDAVNLGLGYDANRWRAGLEASAPRGTADPRLLMPETRYSVEARGAVDLSPRISIAGSLRYRPAPQNATPLDSNRDDRGVMLGGAVAF